MVHMAAENYKKKTRKTEKSLFILIENWSAYTSDQQLFKKKITKVALEVFQECLNSRKKF